MMARLLAADGHDVVVFEAGDEIGGLCRSRNVDGYEFDLAGGHILFTREERVARFWDELFIDEPAHVSERKTRILHDVGQWVSYPFENALGELPLEHNIECTEGVLRAHLQRLHTYGLREVALDPRMLLDRLARDDGGDEERALLLEQLHRDVVQVGAVLDRVDTGAQRGVDAPRAVRVRSHLAAQQA